jgi:hypothetical protein
MAARGRCHLFGGDQVSKRPHASPSAALFGLLAAIGVLWATRNGPICTTDSMSYLYAAQSLTSHGNLRVPVARWHDVDSTTALITFPPGYPMALAAVHKIGIPVLGAVRIVSACAAFVSIFTLVLIMATEGWRAGLGMMLLVLALPALTEVHLGALSEPLFLAAFAATLALMASVPSHPWTYGATAAIGVMLRYAGISLVGAASIWAFQSAIASGKLPPTSRRTHLIRGVRAALLAALPGIAFWVAWQFRAWREHRKVPAATAIWAGTLKAALVEGGYRLVVHLAPVSLPWSWRKMVALSAACVAVSLVIVGWRYSGRAIHERTRRLGAASALTASCYVAVLIYSRLFVGKTIPFDNRLLSPLLMSSAVVVAIAAIAVWRNFRLRGPGWAPHAAVFLSGLWLAAGILQSLRVAAMAAPAARRDYLSAYWQDTPTAAWVRATGRHYALFTNDPSAIFFTAGRPSRLLPKTLDQDSVRAFGERLRQTGGAIVAYARPYDKMADPGRLARILSLCPAVSSWDGGTVWVRPDKPPSACADAK